MNQTFQDFLHVSRTIARKQNFISSVPHITHTDIQQTCPNRVSLYNSVLLTNAMEPRSILYRRLDSGKSVQTYTPERHSNLARRPGGFVFLPGKLPPSSENNGCRRLTKLLLNVTIERSFGAVHVVLSPENTVGDLIKTAVEIYVKEMRRPVLTETDPHRFELHYSQFSLESKLYIKHFFIPPSFFIFLFY